VERHTGIVLKMYRERPHKMVILDDKFGKIVGIFNRGMVHQGALISYGVTVQERILFLDTIELLIAPCAIAKHDIVFLHHVLELCYYLIPTGTYTQDLLQFLIQLYERWQPGTTELVKKAIVFRLGAMLGIYAEDEISKPLLFHRLTTESIDTIVHTILDLGIEKIFTQWLHSCVAIHPHAKYFKTLSFYLRDE
jgi:hypothetical protein